MWSVICFLTAKNNKPVKIHCYICNVCGEQAMRNSIERNILMKVVKMFTSIIRAGDCYY